jgi:hypothetical protein
MYVAEGQRVVNRAIPLAATGEMAAVLHNLAHYVPSSGEPSVPSSALRLATASERWGCPAFAREACSCSFQHLKASLACRWPEFPTCNNVVTGVSCCVSRVLAPPGAAMEILARTSLPRGYCALRRVCRPACQMSGCPSIPSAPPCVHPADSTGSAVHCLTRLRSGRHLQRSAHTGVSCAGSCAQYLRELLRVSMGAGGADRCT